MSYYPDAPNKYSRIGKIARLTGWKPKFTYWQYKTVCNYTDKGEGINRYCRDISKSHVDKCFKAAFGYSSLLSPDGDQKGVVKSEENFSHDGAIKQAPLSLPEGKVFQRLINTHIGQGFIDWRAVIVMGRVAGWIKKTKPERFTDRNVKFEFTSEPPFTHLSSRVACVEAFCSEIGMDYGEIDYLVDNDTGAHYIIDANKTPGGASKVEVLGNDFINAHKHLFQ